MRFETLMRKVCRAGMVAWVLVCGFGLTSHAQADYLAFGGTGYHDATLTLDFAGGASTTLSTNALETGNRRPPRAGGAQAPQTSMATQITSRGTPSGQHGATSSCSISRDRPARSPPRH